MKASSVMTRIVGHLKHNVVAYLALFVALGGTSYAAIELPAGSVGTKQLRNGAVTNAKLARHAVGASQLDPKSIAGHIAMWAQIEADGHVTSSSPKATVKLTAPGRGLELVSWHTAISSRCIAMVDPTNVGPATASASAYAVGPFGHGRNAYFFISTFDGDGNNVPENVNIIVVCP
jgi:hypothetical protein